MKGGRRNTVRASQGALSECRTGEGERNCEGITAKDREKEREREGHRERTLDV